MFQNFFGRPDFIGLRERNVEGGGQNPIPGGGSNIFITANGVNFYGGNTAATIGNYYQGLSITALFLNTNTGASTININGLGSVPLKKNGGIDNIANGDIIAGGIYTIVYDGSSFQIVINTAL